MPGVAGMSLAAAVSPSFEPTLGSIVTFFPSFFPSGFEPSWAFFEPSASVFFSPARGSNVEVLDELSLSEPVNLRCKLLMVLKVLCKTCFD